MILQMKEISIEDKHTLYLIFQGFMELGWKNTFFFFQHSRQAVAIELKIDLNAMGGKESRMLEVKTIYIYIYRERDRDTYTYTYI